MRVIRIVWNSIVQSLLEFKNNKLRTSLSLMGIVFGIFCIVMVFAAVNSLERNVKNDLRSLGTNTIYVQKWPWGGGSDYPWWKYVNRPVTEHREMDMVQRQVSTAKHVAFVLFNNARVSYDKMVMEGVQWFGVSDQFHLIQPVQLHGGRYMSSSEFASGANVVVIGFLLAEKLYGDPTKALGKDLVMSNRKTRVIGVVKKQGQSMIGAWDYDNSVIVSYSYCKQFVAEGRNDNNRFMMVAGYEQIPVATLKEELRGVMRALRKLSPTDEDNFSLNDINANADQMNSFFKTLNIGGLVIAILSLIVGAFGVANIMFVTVKERTSQIGLKKAVGAKRSTILTEFLLESIILCIIGGLIAIFLVWAITSAVSAFLGFPIGISLSLFLFAIGVCVFVGVLSGIVPANQAAKMNPVVAIRSK
jgi:putative ABC transport system permease protein